MNRTLEKFLEDAARHYVDAIARTTGQEAAEDVRQCLADCLRFTDRQIASGDLVTPDWHSYAMHQGVGITGYVAAHEMREVLGDMHPCGDGRLVLELMADAGGVDAEDLETRLLSELSFELRARGAVSIDDVPARELQEALCHCVDQLRWDNSRFKDIPDVGDVNANVKSDDILVQEGQRQLRSAGQRGGRR